MWLTKADRLTRKIKQLEEELSSAHDIAGSRLVRLQEISADLKMKEKTIETLNQQLRRLLAVHLNASFDSKVDESEYVRALESEHLVLSNAYEELKELSKEQREEINTWRRAMKACCT